MIKLENMGTVNKNRVSCSRFFVFCTAICGIEIRKTRLTAHHYQTTRTDLWTTILPRKDNVLYAADKHITK